jgi:hypothetical protein
MSEVVKITEATTLNVEVTGREVLENVRAAFDCSDRPDTIDETIIEVRFFDEEEGEMDQLFTILGVDDPETRKKIADADYLALFS